MKKGIFGETLMLKAELVEPSKKIAESRIKNTRARNWQVITQREVTNRTTFSFESFILVSQEIKCRFHY